MSLIKSYSVGNGDMFYIEHGSDNFTIIDCCMDDSNSDAIIREIKSRSCSKGIVRFISTHPDQDHLRGIKKLFEQVDIPNFYCIKNATKKEDETTDFIEYKKLRDGSKAFYIYKGCSRKWMNESDSERGSSGMNILWPDIENKHFLDALENVKSGNSPNNISPILRYSLENGPSIVWMGDLEAEFMEKIEANISLPKTNILFAPHHGRISGKVPKKFLDEMEPDIIILGGALSKFLDYYSGYNTITQNSAHDITFDCLAGEVNIYSTNPKYSVSFLSNFKKVDKYGGYYIGTFTL